MSGDESRRYRSLVICAVVLIAWVGAAHAIPDAPNLRRMPPAMSVAADVMSSFAPNSHRLLTRMEHTIDHFLFLLGDVGLFWLWTTVSVIFFLLIAAFASVVDMRMLRLGGQHPGLLSRYLGYGVRTFFAVLWDRHTPYTARLLLALALVYWLVPSDLIADQSVLPGFIDDVVITIAAAKAFVYLCPPALIAAHAAEVEWRATSRQA